MLHNICGRAKSGKTEYLLSLCHELIKQKKHTFLIVPEQGAVITERQIIERLGNRSNEYIEVINFKRLCNRVFRKTGGLTQSYVDSAHKLIIMSKVIEDARSLFLEFRGASENPDFAKKALSAISEFKSFGITPGLLEKGADKLSEENPRLCAKLRDFSLLYAQYSYLLSEYGYCDSSDDLERLCSVLNDTKFFSGKTVIIDSFYGFTVPELNIIDKIVRDADDVYVSYLLDQDRSNLLFERGKKGYERICGFAKNHFVPFEDITLRFDGGYKSERLCVLEKNFAFEIASSEPSGEATKDDGSVRIIECENQYDEVRLAAAAVNHLVTHCNAKFSDIAICARSIGDYYGILDTELSKNGIPFNFNIRYDLLTRPVIAYVLAAFEFIRSYSKQSALRLIKTGLTLLSEREADLAECYIRTWNVQGRMFTETEWLMNPDGYVSAQDMGERARETLETVENARIKLVTPLISFGEDVKSAECVNDISKAVVRLLSESKYSQENLCDDEIRYHNMIMDALDCMADVIGSEKITPKKYAALLEMILCEYDTGKIPGAIDEVSVSDAELHRAARTDYMIVLGVNDGIFPHTPSGDSIFSDKERITLSRLGLELSGITSDKVFDELFLAYKVISAPEKGLFLLYSQKSTSGDDAMPSSIISMCKSALGDVKTESTTDAIELLFSLCDNSLASMAARTNIPELASALKEYLKSKGISVISRDDTRQNYLSKSMAEDIFGENMTLSPSRLDKFNYCSCSYFGTYTLGLRPEPVATLGAAESGNIIHKILELLICELAEKKRNGEEITEEYAVLREKELLSKYISELVGGEKAQKNLSKRFKYLYGRLSGALDSCVSAMTRELINSDFIPTDFEMSIGGVGADVQFASIPIPAKDGSQNGTLTINGKIDRTDVYVKNGKAYIKVVDYKTGNKKFSLSDVALGINLQMLLYLYSLTKNCGTRYGTDTAIPAGVLYTPIHRPSMNIELGESSELNEKTAFKTNGILIDDLEILTAMEKNLEGNFIPVKLKKDGSFYSNSSVTSLETMGRMLSTAAEVASKLAYEMKSGKIMKNPYKCDINSCAFCDLAPFCRYEQGEEGTRYAMTKYSQETFERTSGGDTGDA